MKHFTTFRGFGASGDELLGGGAAQNEIVKKQSEIEKANREWDKGQARVRFAENLPAILTVAGGALVLALVLYFRGRK